MATAHVWHKLHLHRHQVTLRLGVLLLLALPTAALGQKSSYSKASRGKNGRVKSVTVNNLPGYDTRWFHPGFFVGVNGSRYRLEHSQAYVNNLQNGQGIAANAKFSPGFAVGFIGDARLTDYLSIRFTPGVSFLTRQVEFKKIGSVADTIVDQEISFTQLDLPLLFKLKSERRRNTRVYLVGGVRPSVNVGTRRRDPVSSQLKLGNSDLAIEYGVGLDLFYPFFKFAPELRFSHGLPNMLQSGNDVYTNSFQRVRSSTVTLYLNFE
ncbi:type IX secretion/gliding motility protein PorT/SprT [Hymenobacter latericus]|uniref:type IX secretion/gliding motility protein PorT/SprT n=1 Tax=Hymenobacter sp. YIM 151858-1 TaxID=2987688 RepID=UPI00222650F7|nr:porin family protein [Hymenobacter sp. YIM 151858-1]UYZ60449.1 PorT family protein [Hymenobacter sp. YIM 151858-1]